METIIYIREPSLILYIGKNERNTYCVQLEDCGRSYSEFFKDEDDIEEYLSEFDLDYYELKDNQ